MMDFKLLSLGLLILLGGIAMIVAVFSPCWIYWVIGSIEDDIYLYNNETGCIGIVFDVNYGYWLTLVLWLMLASGLLYILMCYFFYKGCRRVFKVGYANTFKKWFAAIALCSVVIGVFSICAVIVTIVHLNTIKRDNNYGVIGYSGWAALGSGSITIVVFLWSLFILFFQKWEAAQIVQPTNPLPQPPVQTVQLVLVPQPTTESQTADVVETPILGASQAQTSQNIPSSQATGETPVLGTSQPQTFQLVPVPRASGETPILGATHPQPQTFQLVPVAQTTTQQAVTMIQMVPTSPSAPPVEEVQRVYPSTS